jgi:hypothetical protein
MMVSMISCFSFYFPIVARSLVASARAKQLSREGGELHFFGTNQCKKCGVVVCVCASVLFFCFQKALCEDTEAKEHNTEAESMESVHIRGQFSQKNVRDRGF